MTRAYSEDLRERALARADRGETIRSIAPELQISASCVSKWKKLRRETGELKPGKMGGHKQAVLAGANADGLRAHCGRPVHPSQADGGTGCTWHQDTPENCLAVCAHGGVEL